jgi:KipI family sensor histidine kinase inhibitor
MRPLSGRSTPSVEPFGERAFLVILGGGIALATNRRVHALAAAIRAEAADGVPWGHPVPAYESVLVPFDPDELASEAAEARLASLAATIAAGPVSPAGASPADALPVFEIPTRYGGADGPDLAEVAERVGRTPADVAGLHAGRVYTVYMLGFSPGFAYLGNLPRALEVPRRDSPRTTVPAGSVAIAARQSGVYPIASPGGWNLIGRTDVVLWDPRADPPTPLIPGRRVRFVPVGD